MLETKIIKHYFTREICWDTVGRWLLELDSRFNVIMPYYNKLYESELIKFNPMFDTDLYRTYNRKRDEKGILMKTGMGNLTLIPQAIQKAIIYSIIHHKAGWMELTA